MKDIEMTFDIPSSYIEYVMAEDNLTRELAIAKVKSGIEDLINQQAPCPDCLGEGFLTMGAPGDPDAEEIGCESCNGPYDRWLV
jgi:hypothetical protein